MSDGMIGSRTYGDSTLRLTMSKAVPKEIQPGIREITSLYTSESSRGKGKASELLRKVCKEADNVGIVLLIVPKPFDDGLDQDALEQFYSRHGFTKIQDEPIMMARQNGG